MNKLRSQLAAVAVGAVLVGNAAAKDLPDNEINNLMLEAIDNPNETLVEGSGASRVKVMARVSGDLACLFVDRATAKPGYFSGQTMHTWIKHPNGQFVEQDPDGVKVCARKVAHNDVLGHLHGDEKRQAQEVQDEEAGRKVRLAGGQCEVGSQLRGTGGEMGRPEFFVLNEDSRTVGMVIEDTRGVLPKVSADIAQSCPGGVIPRVIASTPKRSF